MVDLQAAAAVGQGRLFHIYTELFAHENVVTAQVLLTAFDVAARTQYLNARNTLKRLLDWKVVPIINENDTTSTDELCFGDNDALAAQVALLVKADLLVLLTDTDGLYTADPREDADARLITRVDDLGELECVQIGAIGPLGSGGMGSKVNSARIATSGGVETVIARGTDPGCSGPAWPARRSARAFPPRPLGSARLQALAALRQAGARQGGGRRRGGQGPAGQGQPAAGGRRRRRGRLRRRRRGHGRRRGGGGAGQGPGQLLQGRTGAGSRGCRAAGWPRCCPQASPEAIHRDYLVLVC